MKKALLLLFGVSLFSSCFLTTIPTVETYREMPSREIKAAKNPDIVEKQLKDLEEVKIKRAFKTQSLTEFAVNSNSNAFLVFKNGKLRYEHYATGKTANSKHSSFSVAKSMVSALVGIAIEERKIKSDSDLVISYLPFLDSAEFGKLKIYHLLQMTSGIRFSENDIYYSENSKKIFDKMKVKSKTGKRFEYWSASYQLLGHVLESAIQPQSITGYLEEKIWQAIGTVSSAEWSIEKETEIEKTFCCIQATAYDYAKFGMLYLNEGLYNTQQLVPTQWIEKSISVNENEGSVKKYNYGWWFFSDSNNDYLARGFKGQYIYVNQEEQTVIVRFGDDWSGVLTKKWADIFKQISEQL